MVVNSAVLKANPKLGKALVGAWYETLALMLAKDAKATAALESHGQGLGHRSRRLQGPARDHVPVFDAGRRAVAATKSPDLVKKMDLVRKFSFDHGLLGEGAKTVDAVGIEFPGGVTLGNKANLKMRFDRELHADGGRRQALKHARVHRASADQSAPGAGRWARPGRAAVHRAAGAVRHRLAPAARRKSRRQAAARARHDRRAPFTATPSKRTAAAAQVLFWADTWASLKRIGSALIISATLAMMLAVGIGVVPRLRALLVAAARTPWP